MAEPASILRIEVVRDEESGRLEQAFRAGNPLATLVELGRAISDPIMGSKVFAHLDEVTGVAASLAVVMDGSDGAAGDTLALMVPGIPTPVVLTATASGAVAANGEFDLNANDTTTAQNLVAAINAFPDAKRWFTATNSTSTVTITARERGATMNDTRFIAKSATTGLFTIASVASTAAGITGTFSGGVGISAQASVAVTCSNAAITTSDTITIGGVVLTVAASPANENEFAEGGDDAGSATNLAAAINAHSKLKGILSASAAGAVCTITCVQPGRVGQLITIATSDASAFAIAGSATTLQLSGTHANVNAGVTFSQGVA